MVMTNVVFLTETAKEQMTTMLQEHDKKAFRLSLKGGGCAGFKYDWTLADEAEKDDEIIDLPEGKFLIDPASIMYLIGSTVDYKKEIFGSYLIENPASTKLRCGESIGF